MIRLLVALACGAAFAQTPKPSFEVISIRPGSMKPVRLPSGISVIGSMLGGPGTSDPELVTMGSVTLHSILMSAYKRKRYQISGPDWIQTTHYDINARVPAGATKEQYDLMLQDLLEQRFNLKFHYETKDFRAYNLVEAKGGLKLRAAVSTDGCSAGGGPLNGTCRTGAVPISGISRSAANDRPMFLTGPKEGGFIATGRASTIAALASALEAQLRGPLIVDKTGIEGTYDIRLEFAPIDVGATQGEFAFPSLFTALEKELGLKLEATNVPLDMLVIDRIEQPTEN